MDDKQFTAETNGPAMAIMLIELMLEDGRIMKADADVLTANLERTIRYLKTCSTDKRWHEAE